MEGDLFVATQLIDPVCQNCEAPYSFDYSLIVCVCRKERVAYYRIANHYKFIMQQLFDCQRYDKLIIVEDDMMFAPDFFPYFEATANLLEQVRFEGAFDLNIIPILIRIIVERAEAPKQMSRSRGRISAPIERETSPDCAELTVFHMPPLATSGDASTSWS